MKTAIGIDLGGTKIKAGLIDENGQILRELQVSTQSTKGRQAVLQQLDDIVARLIQDDTVGGGIGSPGIINPHTNRVIEFGFNIKGWHGSHMTASLEKKYPHLQWRTENDANCAALGELWQGAAKGLSSFVMITLGTGVGGAFYSQETGIFHGAHSLAGELGHVLLFPGGRPCNCGQKGCVEQYASGTALKKLYKERTGTPLKGSIFGMIDQDADAAAIVRDFERHLGLFFVSMTHVFDPDAFIIGGGLIHEMDIWWEGVLETYTKEISFGTKTKLLPAKRLNEAGMMGAAWLVLKNGGL